MGSQRCCSKNTASPEEKEFITLIFLDGRNKQKIGIFDHTFSILAIIDYHFGLKKTLNQR